MTCLSSNVNKELIGSNWSGWILLEAWIREGTWVTYVNTRKFNVGRCYLFKRWISNEIILKLPLAFIVNFSRYSSYSRHSGYSSHTSHSGYSNEMSGDWSGDWYLFQCQLRMEIGSNWSGDWSLFQCQLATKFASNWSGDWSLFQCQLATKFGSNFYKRSDWWLELLE